MIYLKDLAAKNHSRQAWLNYFMLLESGNCPLKNRVFQECKLNRNPNPG